MTKAAGQIERSAALTRAVNLARAWAHEPANIINPVTLAERAVDLAQQHGLKVTVFDETQLAEMGAGGLLSVGKGSRSQPRLIVMEYAGRNPGPDVQPVVLVGKAITFDTGGYSMKDVTNIQGMKYDKCGGVTVAAIMQAVAELALDLPVIGIISAAENMVSADAYRPDDILTMLSGKTVEIISTDAEGRLVLADALHYAQQNYQPRALIDLATLTGGIVTALGRVRAGIMSNNDALVAQLEAAGEHTHERLWRMPLDDDYLKSIKGDDADLKNSGGREGHPIMGGIFLKQFVSDDVPWAHLDIAGVADTPKDLPYSPKGATGFGVRLIVEYLEGLGD
jgi:leucyl aminopeptidase